MDGGVIETWRNLRNMGEIREKRIRGTREIRRNLGSLEIEENVKLGKNGTSETFGRTFGVIGSRVVVV